MPKKFQVISNTPKSDYGLVRMRSVSMGNVAGQWTDWSYYQAGDTTAPTSPTAAQLTLTNTLGAFQIQAKSAYLTSMNADIVKLRWYAREKSSTADETFSSAWLPTAILDPDTTFNYSPDATDSALYYDFWAIAQDVAGNYDTSPAAEQFSDQQATQESVSAIAVQGWQYDGLFTASDHDTVAWASGTLTLSNADTYSIDAGNTGNMAAITYVYFDTGASSTVLQTTTTAATAVGTNKILMAPCQNVTSGKEAIFQAFGGKGTRMGLLITAANIAANTITANEIAANTITASEITAGTITATEMTISTLSAIAANVGTLTAGTVGGWTIASGSMTSAGGDIVLDATNNIIKVLDSATQYIAIEVNSDLPRIIYWADSANSVFPFDMSAAYDSGTGQDHASMGIKTYDGTTLKSSAGFIASSADYETPVMQLKDEDSSKTCSLSCALTTGYFVVDITGGFMDFNGVEIALDAGKKILLDGIGGGSYIYETGGGLVLVSGDGQVDVSGTCMATGGFSDNGTAGIDTTFIDNDGNTITVNGGLVTAKTAP